MSGRSPPSVRRFIQPLQGDSWDSIANRILPDTPRADAIDMLKSWNMPLSFRPVGIITPSDIMFVEPPVAAAAV
jgi:hypothetical protein